MSSTDFPTTLADLTLNDSSNNPSLYSHLRSIRKSALSIPNRLNSILEDASFAKQISELYRLPLVANERCGSWYIDPADKSGSAYFKSTDGHHGQWDFSLRRLNLQLLPILSRHGGAVIVDSTRRGKNLPDAFSKTVPIWVSVINRALFPDFPSTHRLQTPPPPDDLGQSEISQVEFRLQGFAKAFISLGLDLPRLRDELKRPIQVQWAINRGSDPESDGENHDLESPALPTAQQPECHQLVLCSVSRRVHGAEASEGGYIQGAGDDSEGWSHGLTAQTFWLHKDELMRSAEEELPKLIEKFLQSETQHPLRGTQFTKIEPTSNIYIGLGPAERVDGFDLIINVQGQGHDGQHSESSHLVNLDCRSGKLGSKDLREKLPGISRIVENQLAKNSQSQVLVTCDTGKDHSAGVVAALLCLFYTNEGWMARPVEKARFEANCAVQVT